jgi:DNA-binding beta-propeller fold protein YncE
MGKAYFKVLIAVALLFGACKKEETSVTLPADGQRVLVVCEGSMGNGNAALSLYLPEKDSVYEDVYKAINNKNLGDVFQSITKINAKLYCCINNSDKIIVLNEDLSLNNFISVPKPRYMLQVSQKKAYVSSLFNNKLYVLNGSDQTVYKQIDLPASNAEGMLLHNNEVFVCPWDTANNKVYVLDPSSDQLKDSFSVGGYAPQEILLDRENKLWILSGNVSKGRQAFFTRVDPDTRQVLGSYAFSATADPVRPVMNNNRDSIYFIEVNNNGGTDNNGIYRMSIHDAQLPQQPFIPAASFQYFWALGIDPVSGDIYVGDPKGFIQKSTVYVYSPDGQLKKQFNAGVGVGHFYFTY